MLTVDDDGTKVRTKIDSVFPKGTIGQIITCQFVGSTTVRAYCIHTSEDVKGMVIGFKSEWYLERDLENVCEN